MVRQYDGQSWRVGGASGAEYEEGWRRHTVDTCPVSPSHPGVANGPRVLTLWKSRETLLVNARAAMSQWILKTLYLPEGERGGEGTTDIRVSGPHKRRAGSGWGGLYVFLQSTDTQKMPAARKQADMVR